MHHHIKFVRLPTIAKKHTKDVRQPRLLITPTISDKSVSSRINVSGKYYLVEKKVLMSSLGSPPVNRLSLLYLTASGSGTGGDGSAYSQNVDSGHGGSHGIVYGNLTESNLHVRRGTGGQRDACGLRLERRHAIFGHGG